MSHHLRTNSDAIAVLPYIYYTAFHAALFLATAIVGAFLCASHGALVGVPGWSRAPSFKDIGAL
jgi:hypothetical protein